MEQSPSLALPPAVRRQGISSQTKFPTTKKNGRKRWIHPSEIFVSIRPTLLIFLLNPSFPFYIGENKGFLVAFRNGEILMIDWGLITKNRHMNPSTKVISCSNLRLDRSQPPSLCDSYRIQTYNLLIRSQMLYSVELRSQKAVRTGLEPVTPCVTGMYSNQLN